MTTVVSPMSAGIPRLVNVLVLRIARSKLTKQELRPIERHAGLSQMIAVVATIAVAVEASVPLPL